MTVPLLIIAGKMLDTCHDTLTLKAFDITHSHLAGKIRIFAEVLEIASAHR